jgi:hypothetical protein
MEKRFLFNRVDMCGANAIVNERVIPAATIFLVAAVSPLTIVDLAMAWTNLTFDRSRTEPPVKHDLFGMWI